MFAVQQGEKKGADFIEIRFEDLFARTLAKEKETMKEVTSTRRRGVDVVAYYKGVQGFSHSSSLDKADILDTVHQLQTRITRKRCSGQKLKNPAECLGSVN